MSGTRRAWAIGLVLALTAFGLYGVTTSFFVGYEDETVAVSEGLVNAGAPRIVPGTPLTNQGIPGRGGQRYGRAGLVQPLLEAPFYYVGKKLDEATSTGRSYRWRRIVMYLYEPTMAALTVLAIFALLTLRGVPERRAIGTTLLCAFATLIWPYSKIGMDTTLMAVVAATVVAAAWAARRASARRLGAFGFAVGMAAATKPYGLLLALGASPLMFDALRRLPIPERRRVLLAFAIPVLAWLAVIGWYNWYRTGSITNFDDPPIWSVIASPINAIGLFFSPGKGLVLYSPLVILGLLGMRRLWTADRSLGLTIASMVVINTAVAATSAYWTDETWGPRYLLPTAWLLVVPIAWWATTRVRARVLAVVTALALYIQVAAVIVTYQVSLVVAPRFAGEPVFQPHGDAAYGNDGPRWIPQASELLFQVELLAAYVKEQVTGTGFVVHYTPFRGRAEAISLEHPQQDLGVHLPDFWWAYPGTTTMEGVLAGLLGVLALGGGAVLTRRLIAPGPRVSAVAMA